MLDVGDSYPSFELMDQNGDIFVSEELFEAPAVIYFYPKDDTPGCTAEACYFRDSLERFNDLGVRVVGISPDSVGSHKAFSDKYHLNFTLLSDPDHKVCEEFGVWREKLERSTFLVDEEGIIKWIERPVKVEGQIERLFTAIRKYANLEQQE
jgi:peroxiredoxin Q/BCP